MHYRPNGIRYNYLGTTGMLAPDEVSRARDRLRAAGVKADDLIAEFDWALRPHIVVYSPSTTVNDEIVTAIAGSAPADRAAVLVAPTYDRCDGEAKAIAEAVAEAAGRAKRIAGLIGSTANPLPVTVAIEHGTLDRACDPREVVGKETSATETERDAALRESPPPDIIRVFDAGVFAAFAITTPRALVGSVKEAIPQDHSWIASFGYVAPPTQYPAASVQSDAQLELILHRHNRNAEDPTIGDQCLPAADMLARDTIRAAVEHATGATDKRLIAIDLRGPFAVEGTCQNASAYPSVDPLRDSSNVRIAAYARVSFGR